MKKHIRTTNEPKLLIKTPDTEMRKKTNGEIFFLKALKQKNLYTLA